MLRTVASVVLLAVPSFVPLALYLSGYEVPVGAVLVPFGCWAALTAMVVALLRGAEGSDPVTVPSDVFITYVPGGAAGPPRVLVFDDLERAALAAREHGTAVFAPDGTVAVPADQALAR